MESPDQDPATGAQRAAVEGLARRLGRPGPELKSARHARGVIRAMNVSLEARESRARRGEVSPAQTAELERLARRLKVPVPAPETYHKATALLRQWRLRAQRLDRYQARGIARKVGLE